MLRILHLIKPVRYNFVHLFYFLILLYLNRCLLCPLCSLYFHRFLHRFRILPLVRLLLPPPRYPSHLLYNRLLLLLVLLVFVFRFFFLSGLCVCLLRPLYLLIFPLCFLCFYLLYCICYCIPRLLLIPCLLLIPRRLNNLLICCLYRLLLVPRRLKPYLLGFIRLVLLVYIFVRFLILPAVILI